MNAISENKKNYEPGTGRWRVVIFWMVLSVLGATAAACDEDDDNYIDGSVTESYNMNFDFVRARLYIGSALAIDYVKKSDAGEKIPLRITINNTTTELRVGVDYNLLTDGAIVRGVGYDSSPLPEMISGSVRLDTYEPPSEVSGSFNAVYKATSGAKINLRGGFSADVEVIQ